MRCLPLIIGFLVCPGSLASQTQGMVEGQPKLFYESLGHGREAIVVLHGGPGLSHDYLRPEWDRLVASGRVIYYDQNGCGRSGRVPPYGWRSHVEDLDRLLSSLAPNERVVLAGSSWGSMLALYYTYEHPGRVRALVLSGVPLGIVAGAPTQGVGARPAPSIDKSQRLPSAPWQDQIPVSRWDSVNRGLPVGKGVARPRLEPRLAKRIKEDCADVAGIINMSLSDAPRSLMLKSITVPALVIHGSNAGQMSGDGGPGLAAILPNAKLVTIAKAGHDPWLDQPKTFFAAVHTFLAAIPSGHRAEQDDAGQSQP